MGASTEEDEGDSEGSFSDSEINTDSTEAEQFERSGQLRIGREINHHYDSEDVTQSSRFDETKGNSGLNRKLVLRIPRCNLKVEFPSGIAKAECSTQNKEVMSRASANLESVEPELTIEPGHSSACKPEIMTDGMQAGTSGLHDVSAIHSNNSIKWGEVKTRSSKRCKYSDSAGGMRPASNNAFSLEAPHENGDGIQPAINLDKIQENRSTAEYSGDSLLDKEKINNNSTYADGENNTEQINNTSQPKSLKLKIRSRGFADEANISDKSRTTTVGNITNSEHVKVSKQHDEDSAIDQHRSADFCNLSRSFQECTDNESAGVHDSKNLDSAEMYAAVYTGSKSNNKKILDSDECTNEDSTSISNDDGGYQPPECSPVTAASGRLRRSSRRSFVYSGDGTTEDDVSQVKGSYGSHRASTSGRRTITDVREVVCRPTSKTVGLRSARNKRDNCDFTGTHLSGKRRQESSKYLWLMLREHEESYRYIPQLGDEVMYLGQGHEEYLELTRSSYYCPWNRIEGLKAAELCKIRGLDYTTFRGSGESSCKLNIEFIDKTSKGFGKTFTITLPELANFPDFLVERTRYEAAMERNWTLRDKCKVWWRNEGGEGGTWWEGRVSAVKPKSPDFPDSPWEKYVIQYKNDGSDQPHSPWELHDVGNLWVPWKHPHIDIEIRNKLLSKLENLQEMSHRNQDRYGALKLDKVAEKSDFVNRFPVQFSVEVIKTRLENNNYRTLEAVRHDATVMIDSAQSYFSKSTEMTKKISKLADWIEQTFSSL